MISGLGMDPFHPSDYLVVQCCVSATYLSPNAINQMGLWAYCYVTFFVERVGYTPHCTPCNCTMTIMDQSNAAMPSAITTYSAL